MKAINAYLQGWKTALGHTKMWILLYVLNLLFAMLSTLPLSGFLNTTVGQSLESTRCLDGFDFTIISDFVNQYGDGFSIILNLSVVILVLFFIYYIFLTGGILKVMKNQGEPFSFGNFWQGCGYYFWRLFFLTAVFLGLHAILIGLCSLYFYLGGISPFEMENEQEVLNTMKILLPFFFIFAFLIFLAHDFTKVALVVEDKLFGSLKLALGCVTKNLLPALGLYFINLLTFLLIYVLYYYLSHSFIPNTGFNILLLFSFGQLFVLSRIILKIVNLGAIWHFYQEYKNSKEDELVTQPPSD